MDAQTCKVIVLDQNIRSMSEFKQIIGRGTRVHEETGNLFFTIIDFRKATEHFADPDFDGAPVQIYEPEEGDSIAPPPMEDAIADVQADSIEAARAGRMPEGPAQWRALAATIAARWAIDRLRETEVRGKYDAGLCEDADAYGRPTPHWEHRDPVDTKRYLAVLKELFDSEQIPEHGAEILWGEADGVPREEIAAEIGVSKTAVGNRLFRMRARFRARLAALGMLTLVLLLLGALLAPVCEVSAPAPRTNPAQPPPEPRVPACDAGSALRPSLRFAP